jgi:hypothetical protein
MILSCQQRRTLVIRWEAGLPVTPEVHVQPAHAFTTENQEDFSNQHNPCNQSLTFAHAKTQLPFYGSPRSLGAFLLWCPSDPAGRGAHSNMLICQTNTSGYASLQPNDIFRRVDRGRAALEAVRIGGERRSKR